MDEGVGDDTECAQQEARAAARGAGDADARDVLASGIDDQFLKDILQVQVVEHFEKRQMLHLLGPKRERPGST